MKSKELYQQILGIGYPWEVRDVEQLSLENEEIYIKVDCASDNAKHLDSGDDYSIYNNRKGRKRRHLDTSQLKTFIVYSVPRVKYLILLSIIMEQMIKLENDSKISG